MDLRQLQFAVTVAEEHSFTHAATATRSPSLA
jgi:DNA-binding transcriptional LysR family regulator